ncbi:MAG TPA: hypothetical protein VH394_30940 [Thermoanaerobaculia bacterium]|nr:hypothetical protein [Thermoanaerobaculia bacterium]
MKKSLVPLALTLALVTPLANAGRLQPATSEPTLSKNDLHPAKDTATLAGLERPDYRTLVVGAAVPGTKAAQCQVQLLGARAVVLETAPLKVQAGSTAQVDFADRIGLRMAAGARVTCDQSFYAYGAAAGVDEPKAVWAEAFGPNAPCDFTVDAAQLEPGVWIATKDGPVHTAVKGKPKGVVCVKVPQDLTVGKMTLEWEVTPAGWSTKKPSGNHNMLFVHRGRFRSNTVSNVNAFGPGKAFIKVAQNVDLPPRNSTNQKMGILLQNGTTYLLRYTYDAANKQVKAEIYQSGNLLKTATFTATAHNKVLLIQAHGLSEKGSFFAEFGHLANQEPPEMPSFGWRYSNFRAEMHVK